MKPDLIQVLNHYDILARDGRTEQLTRNLRWLFDAIVAPSEDCIEWPYGRFPAGYGCVQVAGRARGAHRIAHALATGQWPPMVRHKCDNPPCINPAHLIGGTAADNTRDAVERGLQPAGEKHGCAKLTWPEVREIRATTGRNRDVGAKYGVSRSTIAMIKRGEIWRERR